MATLSDSPYTHVPGPRPPSAPRQEGKRKVGLVPAVTDSDHILVLTPKDGPPQTCQMKAISPADERAARARTVHVCLHRDCQVLGKAWPTFEDMVKDHPHAERLGQAHVYALWSSDPLGVADSKCVDCKKEKDGAPCPKHHGGPVGLIAPAAPPVQS